VQRSCGEFFAEASLNSITYHCDVVVAEKGELLCFPASTFREVVDSDKTFRDAWLQHLARELRRLRSQCERMNLRSATQRIFHYIESEGNNGEIRLTQTKKAWANELGLTHEALYRALNRLHSDGMRAKVETGV
jgi:CRP-like cAMP-binding protein